MDNFTYISILVVFCVALFIVIRFLIKERTKSEILDLRQKFAKTKPWSIEHEEYLKKITELENQKLQS